ncbi:MAG: protein translocase subunit SecF [Actinobacteria bacterium]|nr:protein translocase subunit SecF [Actinomycetota bacterium]
MSAFSRGVAKFRGHDDFHMDLIGRRRIWFAISGAVIVLAIGGLVFRGLNYSVDFKGGAVLSYTTHTALSADDVEALVEREGFDDATVQVIGGDEVTVRVGQLNPDDQASIIDALAKQADVDPAEVNISNVSPTWGAQISKKALQGLIIFLVLVSLYISFRFEWKMALGALAALFHDLIITAGVYALSGREVTPETVIAILTILGYSLYDTVVIYDKVQENTENLGMVAREGYSTVVNHSLNQVLMRSLNTSLVVLLPVGTLLFFGGETLKDFAFALFIGIVTGAYSSVFVAAPLLAVLKEREPRYAQIRARLESRAGRTRPAAAPAPAQRLQPAAVAAGASGGSTSSATAPAGGGGQARPKRATAKKKPKRRRR